MQFSAILKVPISKQKQVFDFILQQEEKSHQLTSETVKKISPSYCEIDIYKKGITSNKHICTQYIYLEEINKKLRFKLNFSIKGSWAALMVELFKGRVRTELEELVREINELFK